jgi:hypothetical protein
MSHLSDEAVAAFADDVLSGAARQRAQRHCADCAECNHAVAVQREAIWALRAAPAPSLPTSLLARLRDVPDTTPIRTPSTFLDSDGTMMFAGFGTAALVPTKPAKRSRRGPIVTTTAVLAAAAAITAGSGAVSHGQPTRHSPTPLDPAHFAADVRPAHGR